MNNFEKIKNEMTTSIKCLTKGLYESSKDDDWEAVLLAALGTVELLRTTNPHLFGKVRLMLDGSDSQTSIENRDMFS